jgi:integrase
MVLVSLHTGIRRGELHALTWENVDLDGGLLTVVGRTAKSKSTRHIRLNADVLTALKGWRAPSLGRGPVFVSPQGGRFTTTKTAWTKLLRRAGIQDFRWHDLRHSFASALVQNKVDLTTVRALMGHSSFALTLRYAHLNDEHQADAVSKLVGLI